MGTPDYQNVVILTGAGISAESGLSTFRDEDGLWCQHRIEDVATPEGFARNPKLVHDFYNQRRAQLSEVEPNAAHLALAELAARWHGNVMLVTQNVDDLHQRASQQHTPTPQYTFIAMHGELKRARCAACNDIHDWLEALDTSTYCANCNRPGQLRPHIVWFGEVPLQMETIYEALDEADLFLSIGTSGNVYPAAGLIAEARYKGHAHCVELNLEPSMGSQMFHESIHGKASEIVPEYVRKLLNSTY